MLFVLLRRFCFSFFTARGGFDFGLQSIKVQITLELFLAWSSLNRFSWIFFGRFEGLATFGLSFDRRLSLQSNKKKAFSFRSCLLYKAYLRYVLLFLNGTSNCFKIGYISFYFWFLRMYCHILTNLKKWFSLCLDLRFNRSSI